jgi:hypothetical protein
VSEAFSKMQNRVIGKIEIGKLEKLLLGNFFLRERESEIGSATRRKSSAFALSCVQ